jgi:uncharacterized caspase-like protein
MEPRRSALIIATDEYAEPKLRRLRAPVRDAEELGRVLADDRIGGFAVEILHNEPEYRIRRKLAQFFANRTRDDLLLVHFSCHGLKDDDGNLYFATPDTEMEHLDSTAVPSEFVNRQMGRSRSRRIALFLDCCYSGAFSRGAMARAGEGVELAERFDGQGQVVITASNAMEYAFEGDELTGSGTPSVFTTALVDGLESGAADRDGDDLVSIDELYDFVYDRVRATTPDQTPSKWTYDLQGDLYIARNPNPKPVSPAELPTDLRNALESPLAGVRGGAVNELERVLAGANARLAVAARLALETLSDDDSRSVSDAASAALALEADPPTRSSGPDRPPPSLAASSSDRRERIDSQARATVSAPLRRSSKDILLRIVFGRFDPGAPRPVWWPSVWPAPRAVVARIAVVAALLLVAAWSFSDERSLERWYALGVALGVVATAGILARRPGFTLLASGFLFGFGVQTIGRSLQAGSREVAWSTVGGAGMLVAAVISLAVLANDDGGRLGVPPARRVRVIAGPLLAIVGAGLWISALIVDVGQESEWISFNWEKGTGATVYHPLSLTESGPPGALGLAVAAVGCALCAALFLSRASWRPLLLVGVLAAVGLQTMLFFATVAAYITYLEGRFGAGTALGLGAGVALLGAACLAYRTLSRSRSLQLAESPSAAG